VRARRLRAIQSKMGRVKSKKRKRERERERELRVRVRARTVCRNSRTTAAAEERLRNGAPRYFPRTRTRKYAVEKKKKKKERKKEKKERERKEKGRSERETETRGREKKVSTPIPPSCSRGAHKFLLLPVDGGRRSGDNFSYFTAHRVALTRAVLHLER